MSWQTAVIGAIGVAGYQQQGAIGKYNKAVKEREALVLEGQAEAIEQKKEFDIARFDKKFQQLEGETKVSFAKSGVVQGTGTAYRIEMANAMEAELQKQLIAYNAKVAADKKLRNKKGGAPIGVTGDVGTLLGDVTALIPGVTDVIDEMGDLFDYVSNDVNLNSGTTYTSGAFSSLN